jgi:hypothetical protein
MTTGSRKDSGANGLAHPRAAWIFIAVLVMLFALGACEGDSNTYVYGPDSTAVCECDDDKDDDRRCGRHGGDH